MAAAFFQSESDSKAISIKHLFFFFFYHFFSFLLKLQKE